MKTFKAILLSVFCLSTSLLYSQDFEGVIEMKLTYKNLPEEMQAYKSMLPTKMNTYIKDANTRVEKPMSQGMSMTIISNRDEGKSFVLIDAMGQKMYSAQDIEDQKEDEESMTINYLDGEKEIAGYTCKKGEMVSDDDVVIFWYTPEISSKAHQEFGNLKGYPLEYSMEEEESGMEIIFKASKVERGAQADSLFVIPEGYQKMDESKMEQMMDGAGGF